MWELENYQPLPAAEVEAAWRDGLNQFAAAMTAERAKTSITGNGRTGNGRTGKRPESHDSTGRGSGCLPGQRRSL